MVIESTASILDLPAFHASLRALEGDAVGSVYPVMHKWKALDQGGGAFMYQCDLINGYTLKFPNAGNYEIKGNLKGMIIPVAGVYVEREKASAYTTTTVGGSGPSAESIAAATVAALMAQAQITPIHADVRAGQASVADAVWSKNL
jgi:hypothetical protein